ncbi:hypothetical protein [Mycolicibacterium palauense]|uniref:hypothetical protein n=1 Tax=Mycolicibacterium palauense TaxID=2034511 RepID=UPI000BFF086E|nr:hypothetical protein [Mycolicibacterium palauense]
MVKKLIATVLGAVAAFFAHNFLRRWVLDRDHDGLVEIDLKPGAWYCDYMGDYMREFGEEVNVRTSVAMMPDGEYAWATATPEWDQEWFEAHGWEFPRRWFPYSHLEGDHDFDIEYRSVGR